MAKTVTIPSNPQPYVCWVNGKKYGPYANNTAVSVPDAVAALIKDKHPSIGVAAMPDTVETKIAHADTALAATVASNLAGAVSTLNNTDTGLGNRITLTETLLDLIGERGVATGGTNGTLVDEEKTWGINDYQNKTVAILAGANDLIYRRTVASNTADTLTLAADLESKTSATATLGGGVGEGEIVLSCIGDLLGLPGNAVTVACVSASGDTGAITASLAGNVLTFTVDSNALGEPQTLSAGSLATYLATAELNTKFAAAEPLTAGNLPLDGTPVAFADGSDGISVTAADNYIIGML